MKAPIIALVVAGSSIAAGAAGFAAGFSFGRSTAPAPIAPAPPSPGVAPPAPPPANAAERMIAEGEDPRRVALAAELLGVATRLRGLDDTSFQGELRTWEQSAEDVTYAQLQRGTDAHIGKHVAYRGGVLEIHDEPNGLTTLRVGVRRRYGVWDDPIWVTSVMPPDESVVEGRTVWVYGAIAGTFTYQSQAGWNISIPEVAAVAVVREERRVR